MTFCSLMEMVQLSSTVPKNAKNKLFLAIVKQQMIWGQILASKVLLMHTIQTVESELFSLFSLFSLSSLVSSIKYIIKYSNPP